jgi:hypothetical protein
MVDGASEVAMTDPNGADRPKPRCRLVGTDGNAIAVIGAVRRALVNAGARDLATEFVQKAWRAGSYDEVLALCFSYVSVE